MNIPVNSTWPCTGPLLDLAVALADRLLPGRRINSHFNNFILFSVAFDTATG
jgi:hypothetical protein